MVDQDSAHLSRRYAEEVRAILPIHLALIDESHVRLVNERGRLQAVVAPLPVHLTCGNAPQLAIHNRQQTIERGAIAVPPLSKQGGDIVRSGQELPPRSAGVSRFGYTLTGPGRLKYGCNDTRTLAADQGGLPGGAGPR